MDAGLVEELLHLPGHVHVVVHWLCAQGWWSHLQVTGGHHSPAYKTPHVELVDGTNSCHCGHQPGLEVQQVDVGGDGVEEDQGGVPEQWPGAHQDDQHDHQGEDGVQVEPVLPVGEHDHQGGDADHHTAQRVCQHMEEDTSDVHAVTTRRIVRRSVAMTMPTMAVTMTILLLMAVTMTIHFLITFLFGRI